MKILHLNTSDSGGAAKAAIRLQEGLRQAGINSKMLVLNQHNAFLPHIFSFHGEQQSLAQKIRYSLLYRWDSYWRQKKMRQYGQNYEIFSFPHSIYDLTEHPLVQEADLVHIHWIAGFMDYSSFFRKIQKPIVWTLHDRNPILGGFHYKLDQEQNPQYEGLNREIRRIKTKAIQQKPELTVISPSRWMQKQAQASAQFKGLEHLLIPNGLDTQVFKPIDKRVARQILNLPQDKKIVLFVSEYIHNRYKGFDFVRQALRQLPQEDLLLCTSGNGAPSDPNLAICNLNFIDDDRLLTVAYAAADIFVMPSLEDNLPNTVLEAMACGTPVLGFDVGGIPEMVQHHNTGLLVEPRNVEDLADKISYLLSHEEVRQNLGKNAREVAIARHNTQQQATAYIDLYQRKLPHLNLQKTLNTSRTFEEVNGN